MKVHSLMIVLALASGAALAAGSYDTGKAPATAGTTTTATTTTTTTTDTAMPKVKKVAKKHHAKHHHVAVRHHHEHVAVHHHRHTTTAMGAGAASPQTDVNANSRQARMDAAYGDWQRRQSGR